MAYKFIRTGRGANAGIWVDDSGNQVDPSTGAILQPAGQKGAPMTPATNPVAASVAPMITPIAEATAPVPQPGALSLVENKAPMAVPVGAQPTVPQSGGVLADQDLLDWSNQKQQAANEAKMVKGENDARNQALYSGMIGFGAGLLNYDARRGYGAALGQGLENFNKAYDTELIANRPKVTPIANGAFSQIVWPDGKVEIVSNDQAQQYLKQDKQMQADILAGRDYRRGSIESIRNDLKDNKKIQTELNDQIAQNEPQIQRLRSALDVVNNMKPGENLLNLPGVNQAAQAFGFGGGDTLANLSQLTNVVVDESLLNTARTKGAISWNEMELFKKPIPKDYASPDVWKPWLENRINVLTKLNEFARNRAAGLKTNASEEEIRGMVSGGSSQPTTSTGNNALPSASVPNLSPSAQKYFQ